MKTTTEKQNNLKEVGYFIAALVFIAVLAIVSQFIANLIPYHLISAGVFAMLLGIAIHPLLTKMGLFGEKYQKSGTSNNATAEISATRTTSPDARGSFGKGINFTSKRILKAGIVLMGFTLSFSQVFMVGKFSLIVMTFTLIAAFGFGNLFGKIFKMNWKLSNLISAGTGICGGSAIAAIAPVIEADDSDVAYAISATFLFDILMVIAFPIMGRAFGMTDLGYGLWAGTAVNDTSSVVAAGYAFSEAAGNFATIVKLTRTLSIVPIVLLFGFINERNKQKEAIIAPVAETNTKKAKINIGKIFPWFIIAFLGFVALRSVLEFMASTIITTETLSMIADYVSKISKFAFVMALCAIGLKTPFTKIVKSGPKPMLHGFIISLIVVVVSFIVQACLGQM